MGNICCGSREESSKAGALLTTVSSEGGDGGTSTSQWETSTGVDSSGALGAAGVSAAAQLSVDQQHQAMDKRGVDAAMATATGGIGGGGSSEDDLALREELARLEIIVQAAGRGMVAVRSTRGSNAYYDQGFAAALGQHLEQTTTFPKHVPRQLPPYKSNNTSASSSSGGNNNRGTSGGSDDKTSTTAATTTTTTESSSSVYARLNQPVWEFIQLGTKSHGLAGCAGENPQAYFDHLAESYLDEVVPNKKRLFANVQPIMESLL